MAALAREVGLDGEHVVAHAESAEGKARVRNQTEAAMSEGVFGVPTMLVDGEPFWGVDSLPQLETFLREGTATIDAGTLARWSALRPSAERRR